MEQIAISQDGQTGFFNHVGLIVAVPPRRAGRLAWSESATNELARVLVEHKLLAFSGGVPFFRVNGCWSSFRNAPGLVGANLSAHFTIVTVNEFGGADSNLWTGQTMDDNPYLSLVESSVLRMEHMPVRMLSSLCAEGVRSGIKEVLGIIRQPLVGTPDGNWVMDDPTIQIPETTDYAHLRKLFAAFDLDLSSHTALYSFLLGAFHARSLDSPRPLLLVDSWEQARGKSAVCSAIKLLVDGREDTTACRNGFGDALQDDLTAATKNGTRVLVVDNLMNHEEFSHPFISAAASNTIAVRHKHAAGTVSPMGLMICMTLVDGQATISKDIVSRSWRIELAGEAQELRPEPVSYARENRAALIGEIVHALTHSTPYKAARSRTALFDSVALGAYALAFNRTPADAATHLQIARLNSYGLSAPVVRHFYASGLPFRDASKHIFRKLSIAESAAKIEATSIHPDAEGATLLGHILIGKEWKNG